MRDNWSLLGIGVPQGVFAWKLWNLNICHTGCISQRLYLAYSFSYLEVPEQTGTEHGISYSQGKRFTA